MFEFFFNMFSDMEYVDEEYFIKKQSELDVVLSDKAKHYVMMV